MADYTLSVAIDGTTRGLNAALTAAQAQIRGFGNRVQNQTRVIDTAFGRVSRTITTSGREVLTWARANEEHANRVGVAFSAVGASVALGLGLATKAAIDWESAWAGVVKTTDASASELPALEQGLRNLTRELPASHQEIAAVAEAAGQLGVKSEDVVGFTRVMVNMGEATNLSSDEAATSLAQMMNIMQTAPADVERLASTIVMLGNNGASTEADITAMALRIAGAGKQIGLAESDVVGFANAMASVGIRAEAGGSSISRTFVLMSDAVNDGGKDLEGFARVADMSADDFARSFRDTPAQAIDAFVQGLGRVGDEGGDVFGVLGDLGIRSVEMRDTLLRLAGSGDLLADSLAMGAQEWERNEALVEEAGKRYETTEARIALAKNSLADFAIDIGSQVLPALASLADGVSSVLQWFTDLPGPVQTALTVLGGLVGVVSGGAGAFLLIAPRVMQLHESFRLLAQSSPAVATGLGRVERAAGKVGKAAGVTGAAAGVAVLLANLVDLADTGDPAALSVEKTTEALLNMQSAADVDALFDLGSGVDDINTALRDMTGSNALGKVNQFGQALDDLFGVNIMSGQNAADEQFDALSKSLASLVQSGHADLAAEQFEMMWSAVDHDKYSRQQLMDLFPEYADSLAEVANNAELAGVSTESLGDASEASAEQVQVATEVAEAAAEALDKQREAQDEASRSFVDVSGTYTAMYDEQMAKAEEAARETAEQKGLEGDAWRDMVGDVSVSLDEYLAELDRQAEAQRNWQTNLLGLTDDLSAQTIQYLQSLGPEGANLVEQLSTATVEQLQQFDENVQSTMAGASSGWVREVEVAIPLVAAVGERMGAEAATALADALANGTTTVDQAAQELGAVIEQGASGEYVITFEADTEPAEEGVSHLRGVIDQYRRDTGASPWRVDADTDPATSKVDTLSDKVETDGESVAPWLVDADTRDATTKSGDARDRIGNMRPHPFQVDANTGLAENATRNWAARERWTDVNVSADTSPASRDIYRNLSGLTVTVGVRAAIGQAQAAVRSIFGGATGGKVSTVAGYAEGGRLPGSPPNDPKADNLLAVTDRGVPIAVRSREWIVQQSASDYYGDGVMSAINAGRVPRSVLLGYAGGGMPGSIPQRSIPAPAAPGAGIVVQPVVSLDGAQVIVEVDGQQMRGYVRTVSQDVVKQQTRADDRSARYARGGV